MSKLLQTLQQTFPECTFKPEEPLAPHTTVKIGGPAEVFTTTTSTSQFIQLAQYAKQHTIPLTILGWGANTLFSDAGLPGLVIQNRAQEIEILDTVVELHDHKVSARLKTVNKTGPYPSFHSIEYDESESPRVSVSLASGTPLPVAINVLISKGVTGLQWYARIPATIGGAIYNNIHGGSHFISEILASVTCITESGELKTYASSELSFAYDYSSFHESNEVIVSAEFTLHKGDTTRAKLVVAEWSQQKKNQPYNTLGCVFQNISKEQQTEHDLPTPSAGYIIDAVLNLKGYREGNAVISHKHAAFIENAGSATAADYLAVIKKVQITAKEKLGFMFTPEIFFKGFSATELQGVFPE